MFFSVAMILMPIIAFAVMHVGAFLNKVFAETSFQMAIAQKGVQYIRSKNVFLLQAGVKKVFNGSSLSSMLTTVVVICEKSDHFLTSKSLSQ